MHRLISAAVLAAATFNAGSAYAAPITIGALSSNDDGSPEIVTDSLNNLEWLRWDVLNVPLFADTLAAIAPGGAYEGWKIAGIDKAQAFLNALLAPSTPTCFADARGNETCTGVAGDYNALLGNNYLDTTSAVYFYSDNGTGSTLGTLFHGTATSNIGRKIEWGEIATADFFNDPNYWAPTSFTFISPVSALLYREVSPVPVPASLPLAVLGLGAFGWIRRRASTSR